MFNITGTKLLPITLDRTCAVRRQLPVDDEQSVIAHHELIERHQCCVEVRCWVTHVATRLPGYDCPISIGESLLQLLLTPLAPYHASATTSSLSATRSSCIDRQSQSLLTLAPILSCCYDDFWQTRRTQCSQLDGVPAHHVSFSCHMIRSGYLQPRWSEASPALSALPK